MTTSIPYKYFMCVVLYVLVPRYLNEVADFRWLLHWQKKYIFKFFFFKYNLE